MKKFLIILTLLFGTGMLAQVGINTSNPQQKVHVYGNTANVRVDGLNETNNSNNLGPDSSTRVLVDANGDLVLGSVTDQPFEILVDSENYIVDGLLTGGPSGGGNQINQTGTGGGYTQAGLPNDISAAIFTLTKSAIVEVNYSISFTIQKNNTHRIDDRDARIVQTAVYFRTVTDPTDPYAGPAVVYDIDGVAINGGPWCISDPICGELGGLIALNGQFYANGSRTRGAYQNFQNTGSDYVKLPAGTYVALFVGQVAVSSAAATGSIKCHLGAGSEDSLQIIAHYYE
jgi:hypothetical protein